MKFLLFQELEQEEKYTRYLRNSASPRYLIRTPYNGVLASQTRHDYSPQSSMIRGVMSPGLVGRW
ncbi:hypothetical protein B7802_07675 [Salmonella enterica]|nr:hypothetical protein [Salmonella enterica]EBI4324843.1 hypothetical protein [Salmonella enterica]EEL1019046.1 hypothetical protein [Salmonella enterica]EEP9538266.1 hypothetical protein [Salmonella enterica]ELK1698054.1 hypothetical protein [Salmonella enterica]